MGYHSYHQRKCVVTGRGLKEHIKWTRAIQRQTLKKYLFQELRMVKA